MAQEELLDLFFRFGLAAILGFLVGLERSRGDRDGAGDDGLRDFVLVALIGAISAFVAEQFDNSWLIATAFLGFVALLMLSYWAERRSNVEDSGVTTEGAAIVTFFLGVLAMQGLYALSIALAIVLLIVLPEDGA